MTAHVFFFLVVSLACRSRAFEISFSKINFQTLNFSNHVFHCVAVVKKLLARADKPGSTPGNAVFCFLVPSLFFVNTIT